VSSETQPGTRSSSKLPIILVLAILGVAALVVGVLYLASGHHNLRGGAGLAVGVILLIVAWWEGARGKSGSAPSS
jgi:membrane protein implicated in regulation of membrane protease activity